ncbi:AbiJ-related protein [Kitasatospora cathayae]|uniref:AbiJ-NTD3 domain-containing protein n=1 Tax=Kitasatospora cathayae TaxID=3004092 RepID=A0ABY7Q8X7_9ACTN|nr:hypothetical protein [Kitasatospora sp. HUAS 3-15]WBP89192.1 hypothetical protein O1G21_27335 [Kitasatospora sp. HUAS 3-15]
MNGAVNRQPFVRQHASTGGFGFARPSLDSERVERLRAGSLDDVTDLDAAYELIRIARADLEAFGTSGGERLDDNEMAILLGVLPAVLRRLGVAFSPPFRDFKSFKSYWKQQGMSGSYDARRRYLAGLFEPVLGKLDTHHPHLVHDRPKSHRITDVTRRRLRERLPVNWWGTLDEVQFLRRLYDLDNLPSNDHRHATATQDIGHHCIADPNDWEADWIWTDPRLALADGDEYLLLFLAEMLHPAVRTDATEVEQLRIFINAALIHDGYELAETDSISGAPVFAPRPIGSGVPGTMKNLFFASNGPKPDFVLGDAINNDILVVRNGDSCLQYDRPLSASGLTWGSLMNWWRAQVPFPEGATDQTVGESLYRRLWTSLHHDPKRPDVITPERLLFRTYCRHYPINETGAAYPALLPQVYLHLDPRTRAERGGKDSVLGRERMDFLLLLPGGVRIVVEVDGRQHYAEGDVASPRLYSKMVAEDRALRLKGYQVYRFGGYELGQATAPAVLRKFFAAVVDPQDR